MYDITLRSSFDHINQWVPEIYKETDVNIKMILVGNKHDLDKNRVYNISLNTYFTIIGCK